MFPSINENTTVKEEDPLLDGVMYQFDFETGNYIVEDGHLIPLLDPEDRIKQWLRFLIHSEFDHVAIYKSTGFGLSLKKYVGKKSLPLGLIASEVKQQLNEKIKLNPLIQEVSKVQTSKNSKGQLIFDIWVLTNKDQTLEVKEIV